jgi:hypothetical protein
MERGRLKHLSNRRKRNRRDAASSGERRRGYFPFFVKTAAQLGGEWTYDPNCGTIDQQNEFVRVFEINVLSRMPLDKSEMGPLKEARAVLTFWA